MPVNAITAIAYDADGSGNTIVGSVGDTSDAFHAAVWRQSIPGDHLSWMVELLPDNGGSAEALGLDALGRVVGTLEDPTVRAVRWEFSGGGWNIVDLYPTGRARVAAHNDGLTVGSFIDGGGVGRACTWDMNGTFTDLLGGEWSSALGHHGGTVVGIDFLILPEALPGLAFARVWDLENGWQDIHPPADAGGAWTWSWASGVDASGRIVGVRGRGHPHDASGQRQIYLRLP